MGGQGIGEGMIGGRVGGRKEERKLENDINTMNGDFEDMLVWMGAHEYICTLHNSSNTNKSGKE